jgi:hypothetical protein
MWRSLFLAVGVYLVLLGFQCLGIQKFILKADNPPASEPWGIDPRGLMTTRREMAPQPWVPYSLMATGTIVGLYCYSIPKRLSAPAK